MKGKPSTELELGVDRHLFAVGINLVLDFQLSKGHRQLGH